MEQNGNSSGRESSFWSEGMVKSLLEGDSPVIKRDDE
jgi:hypothetical protein